MKLVSNNEEPVEPAPSWEITFEVSQGNFGKMIKHGVPSYSGPLFAIFPSDEEGEHPLLLMPYHKIVVIEQVIPMEASVAN
jgi:hypothetical protein